MVVYGQSVCRTANYHLRVGSNVVFSKRDGVLFWGTTLRTLLSDVIHLHGTVRQAVSNVVDEGHIRYTAAGTSNQTVFF